MLEHIDLDAVLIGIKKIKDGKLTSVSGGMLFTAGRTHLTCWGIGTASGTQIFILENSNIDRLISLLENKTSK